MGRSRHWLKISLIILVLTGIQVVQASPLHDHLDHVAGCALCHYNGNSHAIPVICQQIPVVKSHGILTVSDYSLIPVSQPSPFQGRAPPFSIR